jgi:hypothetical protein
MALRFGGGGFDQLASGHDTLECCEQRSAYGGAYLEFESKTYGVGCLDPSGCRYPAVEDRRFKFGACVSLFCLSGQLETAASGRGERAGHLRVFGVFDEAGSSVTLLGCGLLGRRPRRHF